MRREELGEGGDEVDQDDDDAAGHGELVAAELPPGEAPGAGALGALLAGDGGLVGAGDVLDDVLGHAARAAGFGSGVMHHRRHRYRMRGSSHASSRSEISVPITVRTESIRIIAPAR